MKRTIFTAALLISGALQIITAAPVKRSTALEFAENFLGTDSAELAFTSLGSKTKSSEVNFYAFNNPSGGWVIISSDDCAMPVLAYSDKGNLTVDNIPDNMKAYLNAMATNIAKVSEANVTVSKDIATRWATKGIAARTKAGDSPVLLTTAKWSQDNPYNQTVCQMVKSGSTPVKNLATGCVATAMGIVLQYLGYPAAPKGTIPAYTTDTKGYSVPAVDLNAYGNYDWANMPVTTPTTDAQKKAVADLIFHCGAMVEMDYTTEGSGAWSSVIPIALSTYMGFSPAGTECCRENYSDNEWFGMLKAEIDANVPVIYGGSDVQYGEGHQFVIDGYNSNREIHVNWGWGGQMDGWFAVCYIGDYTDIEDVFNYYDSAILGLRTDPSKGTARPELCMFSYDSDPGLSFSGDIVKNGTFTLEAYVYNGSTDYSYNGAAVAALMDSKGTVKEYISKEYSLLVEASDGEYYGEEEISCQCKITKDINIGDFVAILYKNGLGEWTRLGGDNHLISDENYEGAPFYTISRISAIPSIAYIYVPENLKSGDVFYCDLVTGKKLPDSIKWSCDGKTISDYYTVLTSGKHIIKAVIKYSDGTSETIYRTITVQ